MTEFDLIPPDYVRNKILQRRMNWFVVVLALIAVLVALTWLGLRSLIALENGEVVRLREEGRLSATGKAKEQHYRQRAQAAERQLEVLDGLAVRDRVPTFVKAIDAAHVDGVWLDEVRFSRRENAPGGSREAAGAGSQAGVAAATGEAPNAAGKLATALEIDQVAEIAGHAINHSVLAEFMRRLARQPGIAAVRLIDSGMRANAELQVIDAKISLRVDGAARGRP